MSTCMSARASFLPFQTASEGEIYIGGNEVTQTPPYRRPINTVFQKYALFPHLNVYDNIAFGLKLKKMPRADMERKVKAALRMVGMTDYEYRDVDSLSTGGYCPCYRKRA